MKVLLKSMFIILVLISNLSIAWGQDSFNSGNQPAYPSLSVDDTGRKFLFGLTAGAGLSTCRYEYNSIAPPPQLSYRIVPAGGIGFDWRMGRIFSLQMNAMYKGKCDKIDMTKWIDAIVADTDFPPDTSFEGKIIADSFIETKLGYVELSLVPTFTIGQLWELGFGGYAGFGLTGKEVSDYTIKYENYGYPFPDEVVNEERLVNFFILSPEEIIDNELYISQIDYGLYGHLGIRMNPFELSLGVSYSSLSWEPDSKFTDLFIETYDRNYNLTGVVTLSWYPGAGKRG
jgi:hypothetical protein